MIENKITRQYMADVAAQLANLALANNTKDQPLLFEIGTMATDTVVLDPYQDNLLNKYYMIGINGKIHKKTYPDTILSLDISTTGLSGRVDGIAVEFGREYLIWAFGNDDNTDMVGIGVTRKPFSTYTAMSGGQALKGTLVTFTIPGNAYQFTVGAKVVVRTDNTPTNGVGQWNWGTIQTINSDTSIDILMDNNGGYGFNITAIGGGFNEIKQWDNFQPWVVTTTSQTLYASNFRLMGEIYTDLGTGDIKYVFKANDEFRIVNLDEANVNVIWDVSATANATVSCANVIPIWGNKANLITVHSGNTAGDQSAISPTNSSIFYLTVITDPSLAAITMPTGYISLESNTKINISTTFTVAANTYIQVTGYRVPGGMRL